MLRTPKQSIWGSHRDLGQPATFFAVFRRLPLPWLILILQAMAVGAVDFPLRWRWSNPAPHGNNVIDMAFSPALNRTVQVAEQGQIYTSDDLTLWIPRDSGTTNALRGVTFLNTRIIVTGEKGCVLYADSVDEFLHGSLLDGPTTNWLEGVAASPTLAVAVGDNGAIYSSPTGVVWKKQNSQTTEWFRGVAFGAGNFVAVGENGRIYTSGNGTNWTRRTSNTTMDLNRVGFANARFTVVGANGVVLNSLTGGTNWWAENTGATNTLYNSSVNSARVVSGVSEVRLQEITGGWSNQLASSGGPPDWTYYSGVGLPNFFLLAGQTGMMAEGYKTNSSPYFWLPSATSVRHWLFDVTFAERLYVAVGDRATVMTSGNGIDWELELVPQSATNATFLGVGGTTNLLIAVGDLGNVIVSPNNLMSVLVTNVVGTNVIVTNALVSTLGVIWHPILPRPSSNDLQGVTTFDGLYLLAGGAGTILTSPDGTNWSKQTTPSTRFLSGLAASPQRVVCTGDGGTLLTSDNGTNWTAVNMATTNWLYRVRYVNNMFIVVGENGTIRSSADGLTWSSSTSGTSRWLNDVVYVDDTYFAVGNQGTVLSSSNTVTWTDRGLITKKSLSAAATDAGQLVTVGIDGIILRTSVVPNLDPVEVIGYSRILLGDGVHAQNLFLFGGDPDQQFVLHYTSSLIDTQWIAGPHLEFLDSSGSFYYLEEIILTNAPPLEFYRPVLSE